MSIRLWVILYIMTSFACVRLCSRVSHPRSMIISETLLVVRYSPVTNLAARRWTSSTEEVILQTFADFPPLFTMEAISATSCLVFCLPSLF